MNEFLPKSISDCRGKKNVKGLLDHLLPEVFSNKIQQLFVLEATIKSILKSEMERNTTQLGF